MRTNKDPVDFLIAVAKKKPQLQALLDDVFVMTVEEINELSQPLWIRQALLKYKESEGMSMSMYVQARLNVVIAAEEAAAQLPKPTFEVRIWDTVSQFIGGTGHGDKEWKIEVNSGDSFLIVDEELVRFGDSVLKVCQFERYPLMQGSKFVGYMTMENYKGFHRALLNEKHKNL